MCRRRARASCFGGLIALAAILGCSSSSSSEAADAQESRDGEAADGQASRDGEAGLGSDPGACDPSCHWDCFGGAPACSGGSVWHLAYAPRPCCHFGDPWPDPTPMCADYAVFRCAKGCGKGPDTRYAACFAFTGRDYGNQPLPAELLGTLCAEGAPRVVGDACAADADCRPAAAAGRLRCDPSTHACVATPRPVAPPEYGKACGVDHRRVFGGDYVTQSSTCPCYVAGDVSGCTREACTMPCAFDEDCPEGSVCACVPSDLGVGAFCLGVTDRASLDARKAWAVCPDRSDAGGDGGGD